MKYLFRPYVFLLSLFLSASFSVQAQRPALSKAEYAEMKKNPNAVYVCLDSSLSDIKNLICEISKYDKNKNSSLYSFKKYMEQGFNIGLYEEVLYVLEYADVIIQKKSAHL